MISWSKNRSLVTSSKQFSSSKWHFTKNFGTFLRKFFSSVDEPVKKAFCYRLKGNKLYEAICGGLTCPTNEKSAVTSQQKQNLWTFVVEGYFPGYGCKLTVFLKRWVLMWSGLTSTERSQKIWLNQQRLVLWYQYVV